MSDVPVLQVDGLVKHFPITRGVVRRKLVGLVRAVEDVSFEIARGETLALVGKSGCGKSTTGRLVLRLMDPTAGSVRFKGEEIAGLDKDALRRHAPPHADHLPGPLRLAQSAHDGGRDPGRAAAACTRSAMPRRARRAGARAAGGRGPAPEHAQPLSARVLRRPAPAHRHRPRAGGQSRADRAATSRCRRSTSRSRRRSSTCCRTCSSASASPTCSSPTTSPW